MRWCRRGDALAANLIRVRPRFGKLNDPFLGLLRIGIIMLWAASRSCATRAKPAAALIIPFQKSVFTRCGAFGRLAGMLKKMLPILGLPLLVLAGCATS